MVAYNPSYKKRTDFSFSSQEIKDLIIAWIAISFAFMFLFTDGFSVDALLISGLTVGVGFLLHELAHKFVAQHYRCRAEFRASYFMLGLAVLLAYFLGFVFAAPGAVMIEGVRNKKQLGHISVAGPITNIVLAFLFLLIPGSIGSYGYTINVWLAVFNMIPFGPLDGAKVLSWDKRWFAAVLGISLLMLIVPWIF